LVNDYLKRNFEQVLTISTAELITLLVRHDQEDGLALINDFAMLDHSTRIAKASIALAMLSTFFCKSSAFIPFGIVGFVSVRADANWLGQHPWDS
jgi:hypothetical protein